MIYQATREIERAMKAQDLHCSIHETSSSSIVEVGFNGKVAKKMTIRFISRDDDNDFAARCFAIVNVPEDKLTKLRRVVNGLNNEYRFLKFIIDEDNDLNLEFDFPVKGESVGPAAVEILIRTSNILDDCYPKLMSAIWA